MDLGIVLTDKHASSKFSEFILLKCPLSPILVLDEQNSGNNLQSFLGTLTAEQRVIVLISADDEKTSAAIALLGKSLRIEDIIVNGAELESYEKSIEHSLSLQPLMISYIDVSCFYSRNHSDEDVGMTILIGCNNPNAIARLESVLSKISSRIIHIGLNGSAAYFRCIAAGVYYALIHIHSEMQGALARMVKDQTSLIECKEWSNGEITRYNTLLSSGTTNSRTNSHIPTSVPPNVTLLLHDLFKNRSSMPTLTAAAETALGMLTFINDTVPVNDPGEIPLVASEQLCSDFFSAIQFCTDITFAQGITSLKNASDRLQFGIDLNECIKGWQCDNSSLQHGAVLSEYSLVLSRVTSCCPANIIAESTRLAGALRRVVTCCIASGIAVPAMHACISYLDMRRQGGWPRTHI